MIKKFTFIVATRQRRNSERTAYLNISPGARDREKKRRRVRE